MKRFKKLFITLTLAAVAAVSSLAFTACSSSSEYKLTAIGDTLIAPLTLYSSKYDSVDALKEAAGTNKNSSTALKIGIPNDGTNLSRGIKLLETAGLLEVDPAAGYTPEIADIANYLYNITVDPVAANTLPNLLPDYAACTINGTYAIPSGLVPSKDGLIIEKQDESGDNPYVNIIVARTADKDKEIYKTIVQAFQTQTVAQYLLLKYEEAYFPAFDYNPDFTVEDGWVDSITNYTSSSTGKTTVKVGVCGASNEHWNAVQYVLDQQGAGIYIKLVEFDAYNLPNEALNNGDIDLNAFQHKAYLEAEIAASKK